MRTRKKHRRIQQLVKKADPSMMQFAGTLQDTSEKYMIQSSCFNPPCTTRERQSRNVHAHSPTIATDVELGLKGEHEFRQFVSRPALTGMVTPRHRAAVKALVRRTTGLILRLAERMNIHIHFHFLFLHLHRCPSPLPFPFPLRFAFRPNGYYNGEKCGDKRPGANAREATSMGREACTQRGTTRWSTPGMAARTGTSPQHENNMWSCQGVLFFLARASLSTSQVCQTRTERNSRWRQKRTDT